MFTLITRFIFDFLITRSGSQAKGSPASELSALPPPPIPRKRRKKTNVDCEPPHPESFLTQENFLSELGLVTPEVYQRTQAESRRTERRRRTTANPKYKSGTSADTNESDVLYSNQIENTNDIYLINMLSSILLNYHSTKYFLILAALKEIPKK